MNKAVLFAVTFLALATPTIACAQAGFGEDGIWGKGGGAIRLQKNTGARLPLIAFNAELGGAPAVKPFASVQRTTARPGDSIRGEILHYRRYEPEPSHWI